MVMSEKLLKRMIYGITILFCASPFLFFLYINTTATLQFISMVELLQTTSVLTLQMVAIFLLPLAAYLLKLRWDKVEEVGSGHILYMSTALLMIALFMLNNTAHGFLLLILLFFVTKYFKISFTKVLDMLKNPKFMVTTFSGELFMLVVSILVGLTIRRFI